MSNKAQTSKNLDLTFRFLESTSMGTGVNALPNDVSIVPFSNSDKKLNTANEKLIDALNSEGNPVAIAHEPTSKGENWKITPVNF